MKRLILTITIFIIIVFLYFAINYPAPVQDIQQCLGGQKFGFWSGLWHGMIAPISFIISLFKDGSVTIYEINNNGNWYNFGFILGLTSIGGSSRKYR